MGRKSKDIDKVLSLIGEEHRQDIEDQINSNKETNHDKVREAQSVINYFESGGEGFTQRKCNYCLGVFAYAWNISSIAYCSIECARKRLESIGIAWNPNKHPSERWGKTVPAVVPPTALEEINNLLNL